MTTQTEALKLALEALEKVVAGWTQAFAEYKYDSDIPSENQFRDEVFAAIAAIKEALAQQSNEQDFDPNSELTDSEKNILENANTLLSSLKKQKQQSNEQVDKQTVTVLPDGSAFAIASYPLPETHWLYAKREYADGEDEPIELGKPILTHEVRDAVISAVRYAVRGATMCGKESDFDPDALVQNAVYALCGPYTPVAHPPVPTAQPKEPEQEPVAITITGKLGNIYSFTGDYSLKKGDKVYTTPPQRKPLTDGSLINEGTKKPEQEPVAYIDMSKWPPVRFKEGALRVDIEHLDGQKLYTHPPVPTVQPKEPEQEPFGYWYVDDESGAYRGSGFIKGSEQPKFAVSITPLYTTPPQRKPLTDEEIGAILEDTNAFGTRLYTFARAIEAKLKEKNNG